MSDGDKSYVGEEEVLVKETQDIYVTVPELQSVEKNAILETGIYYIYTCTDCGGVISR